MEQLEIAKKSIIFNNMVTSFIQLLKQLYPTKSNDFEVFDSMFRMAKSNQMFPCRNFYCTTKPYWKKIYEKDEGYFLDIPVDGFFQTLNLKDLYLQSSKEQKETLWKRFLVLVDFSRSVYKD